MQKQPILLNTFEKVFSRSFSTRSRRVIELDVSNNILFQIKFFGQKIKRTMMAMNLLKVTLHYSFTRLRVIRQINRIHYSH